MLNIRILNWDPTLESSYSGLIFGLYRVSLFKIVNVRNVNNIIKTLDIIEFRLIFCISYCFFSIVIGVVGTYLKV